jgi:hypothetical protein
MPEYLEDIKIDFEDNFNKVEGDLKAYVLPSVVYARDLRLHHLNKGLSTLGFNPMELMTASTSQQTAVELIDQSLAKHGIHVEDWSDKECEEGRRGLYLHKNGELVYFISHIEQRESDGNKTFTVRSNVKMD